MRFFNQDIQNEITHTEEKLLSDTWGAFNKIQLGLGVGIENCLCGSPRIPLYPVSCNLYTLFVNLYESC